MSDSENEMSIMALMDRPEPKQTFCHGRFSNAFIMEKECEYKVFFEDFSNICRACLNKQNLRPLKEITFVDLFRTLTSIQIDSDDELPKNICYQCIGKLEEVSTFIAVSKNNDFYLKEILRKSKDKLLSVIEESYLECDTTNGSEQSDADESFRGVTAEKSTEPKTGKIKVDTTIKSKKSRATPTTCSICGEQQSSKKQLLEHQKKNVDCRVRQFKCSECDKGFYTKFRLNLHMRSHTKETPYECKICLKKFRHAPNLRRHDDIIHKGLKPFKCEVCGKEFSRLVSKNEHEYTHTGKKPYVCRYCGETFRTYTDHFAHTYLHKINNGDITGTTIAVRKSDTSDQLLVECSICKKSFTSARAIFQHSHAKNESEKEVPLHGMREGFSA
ncbi:hypothetical protein JTB14_020787 [Gonioctena quinquepunctata]|nr:hypothetical protein JTB14_020787 [Gonioctena quinquepunctata]